MKEEESVGGASDKEREADAEAEIELEIMTRVCKPAIHLSLSLILTSFLSLHISRQLLETILMSQTFPLLSQILLLPLLPMSISPLLSQIQIPPLLFLLASSRHMTTISIPVLEEREWKLIYKH